MNREYSENLIREALAPKWKAEEELNQRIRDFEKEQKKSRRKGWKSLPAAAVIALCILGIGSVSVLAANHFSLLSLFRHEEKKVQENAKKLIDKDVKQEETTAEQKEWATFQVKEAVSDRNRVVVQILVSATEPEKYLLKPYHGAKMASALGVEGEDGRLLVEKYAKKTGKECIEVDAGVEAGAVQSVQTEYDEDGNLLFTLEFENTKKTEQMEYLCKTLVCLPEGEHNQSEEEGIHDSFTFTLTDKSKTEIIKYVSDKKKKIKGRNLVVDYVEFEKSDLGIECDITYHCVGKAGDGDYQTSFRLLDSDGNEAELAEMSTPGGGGLDADGKKGFYTLHYPLGMELPDEISLAAKASFGKKVYDTLHFHLEKK